MSDNLDDILEQLMVDCINSKKKPRGYWKDITNVKKHLDLIIEDLGRFPTHAEIKKRDYNLLQAISNHHKGIIKVRELYKEKQIRKPAGYWKDIENVKRELELIIEDLGRFPTQREIVQRNNSLNIGISRYQGGLNKVRKLYDLDSIIKPNNYWEDIENVKTALDLIIENLGRFPTYAEIKKRNTGLNHGIRRHHGGLNKVRKLYQLPLLEKEKNYWKNILNVKTELDLIIKDIGEFPTQNYLREINPSLSTAIYAYHGGINKIRELYQEKPLQKPTGYWQDVETVKRELEPIIQELGRFPTQKEIKERNSNLLYGIQRNHKGSISLKIKLGYADQELGILKELMEGLKDE